jgi:glycine cleavage system H protein
MEFPADVRYTKEHEWARDEGGRVRVGITDFAQDSLGDVV